ncbi:hypothetical protein [Pseudomonas yamanorum]|uniref:hypothetical protein n=1 Tax=Pseudomonas yamanorum TaxID=515393 RepID=UPI00087D1E3D|nr:hypothetical protein [Pseudomonas yamanorum]SDT99549.1 hypothetical protein SAMN05216237_1195 [Pseudomonas yamanorum]
MSLTKAQALLKLREYRRARAEQDCRRADLALQAMELHIETLRAALHSPIVSLAPAPLSGTALKQQEDAHQQTLLMHHKRLTELKQLGNQYDEQGNQIAQLNHLLRDRTRAHEALKKLIEQLVYERSDSDNQED